MTANLPEEFCLNACSHGREDNDERCTFSDAYRLRLRQLAVDDSSIRIS